MRAFRPGQQHFALYGIQAEQIADWCQVHVTTARRWKRGEDPPHAAAQLVELHTTGNLGIVDDAWDGWSIKKELLIAPNGDRFAPGEVMAMQFWRSLARTYQAEQRLPRQADWVEGTWVPASAVSE